MARTKSRARRVAPSPTVPDVQDHITSAPLALLFVLAAVVYLVIAVSAGNGSIRNNAAVPFERACGLGVLAWLIWWSPPLPRVGTFARQALLPALWAATAYLLWVQSEDPGFGWTSGGVPRGPLNLALFVAFAASTAVLFPRPAIYRSALVVSALTFIALGAWVIYGLRPPVIDVDVFHRMGVERLLHGVNPYLPGYPNIYRGPGFYGAGVVKEGKLTVGFPYPPVSLVFAVLGSFLGDYRSMNLVAMVATAACLFLLAPSRHGALVATLYLWLPRNLFVLEQGWTEAQVTALLAVTLLVAKRWPQHLWIALGLFWASKPYAPITVLALPLLLKPLLLKPLLLKSQASWGELGVSWLKTAAKAGGLAAATMLPFVLWDPAAFANSVVEFQFVQPFRPDSLSFMAIYQNNGQPAFSAVFAFLWLVGILLGTVALAWRGRLPARPFSFVMATALGFFGFFALSKQAFANYYYFVSAALCLALALGFAESAGADSNKSEV